MKNHKWIDSQKIAISLKNQRDKEFSMCIGIIIFFILFTSAVIVFADEKVSCKCDRNSDDETCVAYYELKDSGIDVSLICRTKGDTKWKTENN